MSKKRAFGIIASFTAGAFFTVAADYIHSDYTENGCGLVSDTGFMSKVNNLRSEFSAESVLPQEESVNHSAFLGYGAKNEFYQKGDGVLSVASYPPQENYKGAQMVCYALTR